jgi:ATP-dependent helicase/nuclease subunit A
MYYKERLFMQGSVRKKGDSWYYRIDLGKVDGKRTQIERYGGRRKQDADKALRNALKQLDITSQAKCPIRTFLMNGLKLALNQNEPIILTKHINPI